MSFINGYEKSSQENKKILEKIIKMDVYPLASISSYFNSLVKENKLLEMHKFYQKYKSKISDKEWMRVENAIKYWLRIPLKKGYDILHKQDSKYPTGDQVVKEIDDKIKSLKDKGMKFSSKR